MEKQGAPSVIAPFRIEAQPDDDTCGATALHAVYRHFGDDMSLERTIREVHHLADGGTLEVLLGIHALRRGYQVKLHSYNLQRVRPLVGGPSPGRNAPGSCWPNRASRKARSCRPPAWPIAIPQGRRRGALRRPLPCPPARLLRPGPAGAHGPQRHLPLPQQTRVRRVSKGESIYDDLRGKPMGHFVVLCGMERKMVLVADPYQDNPVQPDLYYHVPVGRLINAIMLGIVTYDANIC
jgi:hypothetical protein